MMQQGRRPTVALIGTRGVPARYGGFETCVEEVGARLVERGLDVVVYCRTADVTAPAETGYRGMRLVRLPAVRRRALETLSHTGLSVAHQVRRRADVAVVFNAANAPLLPVLRALRVPVATHVDGLEWRRTKWSGAGRRYYRLAESLAVRWSDALIADARGIRDYYAAEFGAASELISYGAPRVGRDCSRLGELDLGRDGYHLVVARFEPENHVLEIVEGYARSSARLPLVVVGSAPYSGDYTARVRAAADDRVRLLGPLWDQELLDQLYAGCATYLHGHSVGGTNPSLLRAIGAAAPVLAYDVVFNREVLDAAGEYFHGPDDVARLLVRAEANPVATRRRGTTSAARAAAYDWDDVAAAYEALCRRLMSGGRPPARRPSGRRSGRGEAEVARAHAPATATGARAVPVTPLDDLHLGNGVVG